MPTYAYDGPTHKASRKGACPTCAKPATRTRTFSATVNPFNKCPDGEPKTWAEVTADVKARADAWQPDAVEFEHDKCMAARLAPPVAPKVPLSAETVGRSATLLRAMSAATAWLDETTLPIRHIEVSHGFSGEVLVDCGFVDPGVVPAWARALGIDPVTVEDGGHTTYVRMVAQVDGVKWRVGSSIRKPDVGDRLGGVSVEWERDDRGKRSGYGTVAVADLAAGLARMGISEVVV